MLILKIASLVCQALFNGLSQLFDTIHNLIAIATLIALVAFGFIVHFSTVSVQPRQAKTDWWSIFFDLAPLVLCGPHLICSFLVFMANPLQDPLNVNMFAPVEPYLKLAVLINDFVHPIIFLLGNGKGFKAIWKRRCETIVPSLRRGSSVSLMINPSEVQQPEEEEEAVECKPLHFDCVVKFIDDDDSCDDYV